MADLDRQAASRRLAPILSGLLAIFILRVVGQMLVAVGWDFGFLPPMEEWQSGLLPYPCLIFFQVVIIAFYGRIVGDYLRGQGFWIEYHRKRGMGIMIFGAVYFMSMIIRYILRMGLHPEARWFGGTIPIVLHGVLATILLFVGHFQWKRPCLIRNRFSDGADTRPF